MSVVRDFVRVLVFLCLMLSLINGVHSMTAANISVDSDLFRSFTESEQKFSHIHCCTVLPQQGRERGDETNWVCCNLNNALDLITNHLKRVKNLALFIANKKNFLTDLNDVELSKRSSLIIKGQIASQHTTIKCKETSFNFISIFDLQISDLLLVGCGLKKIGQAAITITGCHSVTINQLSITHSPSFGMIILNTEKKYVGKAFIHNSVFASNGHGVSQPKVSIYEIKSSNFSKKLVSGGGLVIIHFMPYSPATYSIIGCTFKDNNKSSIGNTEVNYGTGHGGGLQVYMQNSTKVLNVSIHDCYFHKNRGENGAGAYIRIISSRNVSVSVSNTTFTSNIASKALISNGGGLQISIAAKHYNNTINITNCTFTGNRAYFGGGLSMDCSYGHKNKVYVINSTWSHNMASSGSAVDIARHFPEVFLTKSTFKPVFINCTFIDNVVNMTRQSLSSVGYGAVSIMKVNVEFKSNVKFYNNTGSALSVTWSTVTFNSCNASFENNTSLDGGAVSLNFARLYLCHQGNLSTTTISFIANKADRYGGAVYSHVTDDHMIFSKGSCPFMFSCRDINSTSCKEKVIFTNNTAKRGRSIYLPSLVPCQKDYAFQDKQLIKPKDVFFKMRPFNFTKSVNGSQIATAPCTVNLLRGNISVYPGQTYQLDLQLKDELNIIVPSNTTIFEVNSYYNSKGSNSSMMLSFKDTYIYNYTFTVFGPESMSQKVYMQTIDKPMLMISLTIHTKICPPGYTYHHGGIRNQRMCVCAQYKFYGITECHPNDNHFSSLIAKGTWFGFIKNKTLAERNKSDVFVSSPCFFFCRRDGDSHVFISWENQPNSFPLCMDNRNGTLCGTCNPGYTTYYHHSHFYCGPDNHEVCKWGWLIFIASEILPMTILFIIITGTGLNVTSGCIQGFLLYSHILCTLSTLSSVRVSPFEKSFYSNFLHTFYFPLTLKFFFFRDTAFCISTSNVTTLFIVSLRYVQGLYCIVLIFVVVAFLKCFASYCHGCSRWFRFTTTKNSTIIGMSALYVLSFTSTVEVSLLILQPSPLYNKGYNRYDTRVALYGDKEYFGTHHLPYAVLALACLIVLLVPTVMLLTYPLLSRCLSACHMDGDRSYVGYVLTKGYMYTQLMPFYDMFYASFKDDHRYFAGVYFVYRMVIQLSYYIPNFTEACFVLETFLIAFLIIHTIVQPYQKSSDNIIDGLFLSNLVIINGLTCANTVALYDGERCHFWSAKIASTIQLVLAILPMCIVLSYLIWKYVVYRLYKKCRDMCNSEECRRLLDTSNSLEHQRNVSLQDHSN